MRRFRNYFRKNPGDYATHSAGRMKICDSIIYFKNQKVLRSFFATDFMGEILLNCIMKSFSDDLTCVGDQDKCGWFHLFDIVSEADCLMAVQYGENKTLWFTGESSFCLTGCCTSMKLMHDKITDWFWIIADDIEIFT